MFLSNRNAMSSSTACNSLVLYLGLLYVLGYCVGSDPVLTFHGFTSQKGCPVDNVDYIDGTVELDMTGVTKTQWSQSITIAELSSPTEIVRSRFDNCPNAPTDFYCDSVTGDKYNFTFYKLAEKTYSGQPFYSKIHDSALLGSLPSDSKRYPLIKYGPVQTLTIGDETQEWNDDGDLEFKFDKLPSTLDITYNVSGIDWTTYSVSILDSTGGDIISSTSSVSVTTQVSGSPDEIQVYYEANGCNLTTVVKLEESSPTTTPSPNTTNPDNSTVMPSSGGGLDIKDDDDGCDIICIIIIVVCIILVAIGIAIGVYLAHGHWKTIKVDISIQCTITQKEELVKKIPKIEKCIKVNGSLTMEFYHGTKKLDKECKVADLLSGKEKNKIQEFVTVVMCHSLDKKTKIMKLTIKGFKKCAKAPDSHQMENQTHDDKDKDGVPTNNHSDVSPGIARL